MENNKVTYQFKTNINCSGCIEKITPFLNNWDGVIDWEVDTANKNKILTITVENISQAMVMNRVKEAGFTIEPWEA